MNQEKHNELYNEFIEFFGENDEKNTILVDTFHDETPFKILKKPKIEAELPIKEGGEFSIIENLERKKEMIINEIIIAKLLQSNFRLV